MDADLSRIFVTGTPRLDMITTPSQMLDARPPRITDLVTGTGTNRT